MSEDLYAVPDLTKKVRFQTSEKEDGNADVGDISNVTIYDNCWAEGSTPAKPQDNPTDVQKQTSSVNVSSGKKNLFRAAAVLLGLLCLIFLAAVIVLVALWIQQENIWKMERNRLFVDNAKLTSERGELQTSYNEMKSINHNLTHKTSQLENEKNLLKEMNTNLTNERDELQTSYSKMEGINDNLTHKTSQLENEKTLLKEMNTNLTNERDELQKEIETTHCPAKWIKFGSSCYFLPAVKKNWSDSKNSCENRNAQLVIISSREEQEFMTLFGPGVWIGLTRDHKSLDSWKWVNGTRLFKGYWRENQPDSTGSYNQRENCVEIGSGGINNWNDLQCYRNRKFICEKILK
ncbi:uncharacterized protein LOC143320027 [Chaetodon auriga]|uniref:uncharacterized protein LOC143320027 n=1 Tax=Chaetodon auriga TaxID=39042 RepID=UPI004032A9FC